MAPVPACHIRRDGSFDAGWEMAAQFLLVEARVTGGLSMSVSRLQT